MREDLNTTKTKLRLGHWNVRKMYEIGKLTQVITSEMRQFNLHVLGVSESRWTGSGKMKTTTGETVLYSGRDDNLHHEGVAIILRKGVERCLLEWKPINNRLISARLKGKRINTTLIQCYAPTNDSSDEAKDNFYSQLQAETEKTPRHDLVIMGDLKAKVGKDNTDYERVMGKHVVGTRDDNGERLVEFCAMNNLVIGGTLFTHRDIHKLTWNSPNGRDKNQIDLLMINGVWRRSLIDVRNGKSPGRDNLDAELFKADPGIAATILQPLFTAVWDGEKVPDDWCKGVIVKIPKKGTLSDCNNWRGITLLSVPINHQKNV
ncbi:craniofacial development protein 2-like [Saccostrea echinata]|uniref:craniofacial development protein 2-like n=1 Tax=Saccostrea echinata TaxID=191078 RepID=UPI002A80F97E|nr:craniofacial development protein 2-like [Saccostrea echinata]